MLKTLQTLQHFTDRLQRRNTAAAIDIWQYAEPAGTEPDPLKRNLLQWRRAISAEIPATFAGQPVDVVGFVQRSPTDTDRFAIVRRTIYCCLSDAVPQGLTVHPVDAKRFPVDAWLRVRGVLTVIDREVAIAPDTIQRVGRPAKPYINGVF